MDMKGSGNRIVDAVGQISITGNVIPQNWYKTITRPCGKPYLEAIVILSDIVYWYRPVEVRDERTGEVTAYRKRFKADLLQRSYANIAEQFGITKREATNAVVALEKIGVVKRHLRTIDVQGTKTANVLFLELVPDTLRALTFGEVTPITFKSETSHFEKGDLPLPEVTPPTSRSETNTEITTENTTETTTGDIAATAKAKAASDVKHRHGEYGNVLLTDAELDKLKTEFPADWSQRIERLSGYMESTGKRYKSHLATIRNWARRDAEEGRKQAAKPKAAGSTDGGRRKDMTPEEIMQTHGVDYLTAQEMLADGKF